MFGCNQHEARELILSDRYNDLLSLILDKYKALEAQCDFVVCAGTDYVNAVSTLEFDFNADVANNLGCPILPVVKGLGRDAIQLDNTVRILFESLDEKRCAVLALVVNRVSEAVVNDPSFDLRKSMPENVPGYVIPEHELLNKPTVGEIAKALNAEWVKGSEEGFEHEVGDYKVAAMELPNFMEHLEEGSLIITPGDRSDIILGAFLSDAATTYPKVAGLVLSGGLRPAPQIQKLFKGLRKNHIPVLSVATDTFTTAMNVSSVKTHLLPESKRKIAAALGIVEANLNAAELIDRIDVIKTNRVTPLMFEYELIQRARSVKQRIVLPEGTDDRILRAAEILLLREVVELTLLGNPEEIRQKIGLLGLSLATIDIMDPVSSELREKYAQTYYELRKHKGISEDMAYDTMADVSYFGTMMVHQGDADGMVSGAAHTTQHTIRPSFEIIKTRPDCSLVSSIFLMCFADRVLAYGDCAVNPNPNEEQLADIAISSAETAQVFGVEPLIGMLSYSTGESGKGEDVERVREATRLVKARRPDLKIEGPIQYDAAVDASVAKSKLPGSEVAGHATVLIFPDLNTGNNTYKAVQRAAKAVAIGPVLQGLNKPVNDLSRGCTVPDIVNTVAITAIQAQEDV
jgi:phosphate acetyltransferase